VIIGTQIKAASHSVMIGSHTQIVESAPGMISGELVAIGNGAKGGDSATAVGTGAWANGSYSIALGAASTAEEKEFAISGYIDKVNFSKATVQAKDFLDADGNSIVGGSADLPEMTSEAVGNTIVSRNGNADSDFNQVNAVKGNFGGAQQLRPFSVYGTGHNGRLSLQGGSDNDNPGLEMTTDRNVTRVLQRINRAGTNGTELQVWTQQDGAEIHMPFVFGEGGEFFLRPKGADTAVGNDAGFRNQKGTLEFRNDQGEWTPFDEAGEIDLPEMTNEVSPDTLVMRDGNSSTKFHTINAKGITFNTATIQSNTADTWFLSGGQLSTHGVKKNDAAGMRSSLNVYSKDEVDALSGGGGEGFLKSVDEIEFDYNTEGPIGDVVSWSFNDTYNNVSSDFKITWGKRYYGPLRNVAEGHWIQSSPNGVGLHASKSDGSKESFYWANPAGYAQIYASTTTQIFSPSIALAAPNGGTADGEAAIKLKNNGTSTFKHAIKAADFLDRQGNSIIGAGGGLWTDDGKLGISYGEADGNQGNVNIYGEDRYKPQLCLQGPVGSTPSIWFRGASLGMMDNPLYCQVKASAAGHGNGQELQVWTVTDDEGGYGHQPFVFGSNGTFFIQPDRSTDAVNYDVTAGFRNDDGKLQFRHESGRWNDLTDLGGSTRSVSPTQLIETLSTLRDATRDETTVEGLRDSIGNAIGGIIEKLESQIKTVREMSK
jgi:hypothetical protein